MTNNAGVTETENTAGATRTVIAIVTENETVTAIGITAVATVATAAQALSSVVGITCASQTKTTGGHLCRGPANKRKTLFGGVAPDNAKKTEQLTGIGVKITAAHEIVTREKKAQAREKTRSASENRTRASNEANQ